MGVELINNDSPFGIRVQFHRPFAVFQKVFFRACGTNRRRNGFSTDHMETGDQAQRAMPDVFKFNSLLLTGPHLFLGAICSNACMPVISSMQTVCVSN